MIEKEGITSFKTFMAYKGALMIDDRQMIGLMEEVKKHGGLINVHATNGDMIDYLVQKHQRRRKAFAAVSLSITTGSNRSRSSQNVLLIWQIIPVALVILFILPAKAH